MVMHAAGADLGVGCGVQMVIPRSSNRLDFSGREIRGGDICESTLELRPTKLLDRRMRREFVRAINKRKKL